MYCCTCAAPLAAPSEKQHRGAAFRQLPCCDRIICGRCLETDARFAAYCPYCQIATAPAQDVLPPGLRAPPPYSRLAAAAVQRQSDDPPPPYQDGPATTPTPPEKTATTPILHFLDHDRDSVASLALRYRVPADRLRRANHLAADHLLAARRVVEIPVSSDSDSSSSSVTASLSPQPVEGESAARRKAAIRRFMVACKVADYDLAVLYLDQTAAADNNENDDGPAYDLAAAVAAYQADEQWEQAHPVEAVRRGKAVRTSSSFFSRRHRSNRAA